MGRPGKLSSSSLWSVEAKIPLGKMTVWARRKLCLVSSCVLGYEVFALCWNIQDKKECLLGFLNGSIIRTQSRQINEMELRPLTLSHVFCLRFKCNAGPVWQARGKVTLESNRVMDSWQLLWAAVVLTIQLSGVFAFPISPYQAEYITSISPQSSSFSPRKSMHQEYHHYDVWCWAIEELKSNILEFAAFTA